MQQEINVDPLDLDASLRQMAAAEYDAVAISSWFSPSELSSPMRGERRLADAIVKLLDASSRALRLGGLLFIYGAPHRLPAYAEALDQFSNEEWKLEFKYWIGIQLHEAHRQETLYPAHLGLLLFHKVARRGNDIHFGLNPIRIPHQYCSACGRNLRDWGGKKHLMNPQGSALSDVWLDLPMRPLTDHRMPNDVFERVVALAGGSSSRLLHMVEAEPASDTVVRAESAHTTAYPQSGNGAAIRTRLSLNRVEVADCVEFMERLLPDYAHNAFDLIFADPPYNLEKLYTNYSDAQAEHEYLTWCERWLTLCAQLLKPGGTLFVLNLPKWALSHARTLDKLLDFRHWVVWQALGEPRGKLLPAHYALLYYTKPGAPHVFNYSDEPSEESLGPIDSPEYCLRASCIRQRKALGDDKKVPLTDIWWDIHRIKHKRDRDYHPCQLPEKLLERVIMLASNPGQVVFDPFCGVGTTAVVAKRLGRHYVTTDIDPTYVSITEDKLKQMEENRDLFGDYVVTRTSVRRPPRAVTKKQIESVVQRLALKLGRTPELEDLKNADPELYEAVFELYPNPRKALGAARVVLSD